MKYVRIVGSGTRRMARIFREILTKSGFSLDAWTTSEPCDRSEKPCESWQRSPLVPSVGWFPWFLPIAFSSFLSTINSECYVGCHSSGSEETRKVGSAEYSKAVFVETTRPRRFIELGCSFDWCWNSLSDASALMHCAWSCREELEELQVPRSRIQEYFSWINFLLPWKISFYYRAITSIALLETGRYQGIPKWIVFEVTNELQRPEWIRMETNI